MVCSRSFRPASLLNPPVMEIQRDALSLEGMVLIPRNSTSAGPPKAGSEPRESYFFGLPSNGGPASGKERKESRQRSTQNGSWLQVSTQVTV
jgi:hypothetical protein